MLDCDFIFSSQLCDIVRICTQHKNSISRRHIISTSGHFELLLTNPSWNSVSVLSNWRDFTRLNQCVIAFTIPEKYWVILKYQNSHHMQMEGKANGNFQFERNSVLRCCSTSLFMHHPYCRSSILYFALMQSTYPWQCVSCHAQKNTKPSHVAQMCSVCLHDIKWFVSEWWKHHVDCVLSEHTVGCVLESTISSKISSTSSASAVTVDNGCIHCLWKRKLKTI